MSTSVLVQEVLYIPTPIPNPKSQPAASLYRIDLPANFQLPPLDKVREDAARSGAIAFTELIRMQRDGATSGVDAQAPLAYNMQLPNIFKWSYYAYPDDVPDDLREGCILALRMFIRVLQECDEDDLRRAGHILPGQEFAVAHLAMVMNAGYKLIRHLM
ncbi:hypothetical protein BJ138DRAFT_540841 [Hygrophoropsis aurantiaca]|uniref:Uncharacterized protein n=1 Tax=Hygrophoropsis aurantiaca TaxID=72124 RepID=A0ACB8A318_9AGAM|nr:hypothetical protein BJ138DRAFT_540841 [Hygrophoropsis aurantiaca]